MSVTGSETVKVIPVFRDPNIKLTSPIMARWHGSVTVAGDASGGLYSCAFNLSTVVNLFQSHTLWDLKFVSWKPAGGAIVVTIAVYSVLSYEPTSGGVGLNPQFVEPLISSTGNRADASSINPMDYKFAFEYQQGSFPIVQLQVTPNTAGVSIVGYAGGYIYDEKLI